MWASKVPEESLITYRREKRMKFTETWELPKLDSNSTKREVCSSSTSPVQIVSASRDVAVEIQSVSPHSTRSAQMGVVECDVQMEVTDGTLLKEAVIFHSHSQKSTLNSVAEVLVSDTISNGDIIKNMSEAPCLVEKDSEEFLKIAPVALCSKDPLLHVEISRSDCDLLDVDTSAEPIVSGDAIKNLKETNELQNMDHVEGDIDRLSKPSSSNLLQLDLYEQEATLSPVSLSTSGGYDTVSSKVMNGCVSVGVDNVLEGGNMRKKLLVLDVNGLLADISPYVPYDFDPDEIISRKAVFKRPYCDDFLRFCFEKFYVGVWTSKTKRNMEPILNYLLGNNKNELLFRWDQSHCTDTGYTTVEKRHKPLLVKKLKKLWDKYDPDLPWEKGVYNQYNTVLLDDSPSKAICNPQHTGIFPHTYRFRTMGDNSLAPHGDLRIHLEGLAAAAENVQDYIRKNPFGQRPITERNLSWSYYLKVIEASSSPPHDHIDDEVLVDNIYLQTPESEKSTKQK